MPVSGLMYASPCWLKPVSTVSRFYLKAEATHCALLCHEWRCAS